MQKTIEVGVEPQATRKFLIMATVNGTATKENGEKIMVSIVGDTFEVKVGDRQYFLSMNEIANKVIELDEKLLAEGTQE